MQQFLKSATRATYAWIIAAELLNQFLDAAHNAVTTFHLGFRWESLPALTGHLESTGVRSIWISCCTSFITKAVADTRQPTSRYVSTNPPAESIIAGQLPQ